MFNTILIDPPWPGQGGGKIKRGADRHYPLIKKKEDILRTILQSGMWPIWDNNQGAHLYLWTINNYLEWGLWLMNALGFTYKTNIVWVKVVNNCPSIIDWDVLLKKMIRFGIGRYFRSSHELLLFGVRGKTIIPNKPFPSALLAPREQENGKDKHSKKPLEVYNMIEQTSPEPYLEMFAREKRDNWWVWGNEV